MFTLATYMRYVFTNTYVLDLILYSYSLTSVMARQTAVYIIPIETSIENTRNTYNTQDKTFRPRDIRDICEIISLVHRRRDNINLGLGLFCMPNSAKKKNTRRASDDYDGHGATETVHPLTVSASRSSSSVAAVRYGGGSVQYMAPSSWRVVFGWWRRRSVAGRPRYTTMPINIIHCARQRSFDTVHYVIILFIVYRLLYYYYIGVIILSRPNTIIIYAQNR